jgi:fumarate reductase subunit C
LWAAQRASAAILALCVLAHLGTIIYAVRGGLSAVEVLQRTQGSVAWAVFYTLFVLAVAVHAPIGLRAILAETFGWRGRSLDIFVVLTPPFIPCAPWFCFSISVFTVVFNWL